jgi:mannitol/fructose-specific phosphotransferase system IIA component (Ntr-type)
MLLHERLTPRRVLIAPPVAGRDELFGLFGTVFCDGGLVRDPAHISDRLEEREAILSTGIGGGVAIPHAQIPGLGQLAMAASVHPEGLAYPALDSQPVRLVFCLIGDTGTAADHLAGLARLARLARRAEALARLVAAPTSDDFLNELRAVETA